MTNFEPFKMVTTINLTKGIARRTFILLIISIFSLYSCQSKKLPKGVLSREAFSNLLVEFYVTEARLNTSPIVRDSAMKLFLPFEMKFLKKHKISDEVLSQTYRYYLEHPREFEKVYDVVIDTLSLMEQRAIVRH